MLLIICCFISSPSNEFWNGYEIESFDIISHDDISQDMEDSHSGMSQAADFEWSKAMSYVDDFSSDIGSPSRKISQPPATATATADIGTKKKDAEFRVPLGRLIRECGVRKDTKKAPAKRHAREHARAPNIRQRDRWREQSVSRARDYLVSSKRRAVGLPPVRQSPADGSQFQVPNMMPPSKLREVYRSGRSLFSQPQQPVPPLFPDDRRTGIVSSTNATWIQQSIYVRVTLLI